MRTSNKKAFVALALVILFGGSCSKPTEPEQFHTEIQLETVSGLTVPMSWDSTYYQLPWSLNLNPWDSTTVDSIAKVLASANLNITDLWSPKSNYVCMDIMIGSGVLIKLNALDTTVAKYGFKQNEPLYAPNCIGWWRHYKFVKVAGST